MSIIQKAQQYQYAINLFRSLKLINNERACRDFFEKLDDNHILQVELQPGIHCDIYNCPYCYGKHQELEDGNLEINHYKGLLDEIEGDVPLIQISGVATEPLTYPFINSLIKEIKQRNFQFGLHTKGFRLSQELNHILTEDFNDNESFITISIDAACPEDYVDVHGITRTPSKENQRNFDHYFEIILNNIKNLHSIKHIKGSKLKINITYLLFENNYSVKKVESFINIFSPYCDMIRFSLPQVSNTGNAPRHLSNKNKTIKELRKKYTNNPKVYILSAIDTEHKTLFTKCFAQKFQAVLDKSGNVFPCPQTALKNYNHLSFGNIKEIGFREIISSSNRKRLFSADVDLEMKCRICDRKDEDINITLDKLLN